VSDLAAFPEISYFELQQRVLSVWNDFPGVRLLYKELIIANDPNRVMGEYIEKNIPNATVTSHRLTDLMWAVDGIVVDHAITALGEVLLTKKPLVVYMPVPNASIADAKPLLQKRATVAETADEFVDCVRDFLAAGKFADLDVANDEFLRFYGTYNGDGRSAERAADAVLNDLIIAATEPGREVAGGI
jgi:hypothetical protein